MGGNNVVEVFKKLKMEVNNVELLGKLDEIEEIAKEYTEPLFR